MAEITGSGDLEAQPSKVHGVGEVSARATDFIESRQRVQPGEGEPEILYHYTSAAGLIGILEKGKVWATSIRHLNDASEFVHTLNLADASSQNALLQKHYTLDRYLIDMLIVLHDGEILPPTMCYVGSFSEKGNLLSQWRAYCPSGAGYSIGFSLPQVRKAAEEANLIREEPWRLVRCEYDLVKQKEVLSGFLEDARCAFDLLPNDKQAVYDAYMRNGPIVWDADEPKWATKVVTEYIKAVQTVAPAFKDPAFVEEAEWRVVSPFPAPWDFDAEKYRAGRYCPVPYVDFELPCGADERLQIEKIIIGPTENPDLSAMTVKRMCGKYNVDVGEIEQSNVPFRHWDSK